MSSEGAPALRPKMGLMSDTSDWHPIRRRPCGGLLAAAAATTLLLTACASNSASSKSSAITGTTATSGGDAALGKPNRATDTAIKVGFVNAEGGPAVSFPQIRQGAEAATKYINDYLGGLNGHPIDLVLCRDLGDGASLVTCGNQFVQDKIPVVIEGAITNENVIGTVTAAGIPWVGDVTTLKGLSRPNVFAPSSSALALAGFQAEMADQKGYKHVLVVQIENPTATQLTNELLRPTLAKHGISLDLVTVPPGAADPTPQVVAGLNKQPDMIWIVGPATFCKGVLPPLISANTKKVPLGAITNCVSQVRDLVPDGTTLVNPYFPGANDNESKLYEAVMKKYAPDADVTGSTSTGFRPIVSLARALNAAGVKDITAENVIKAMKSAKNVPLPLSMGKTFTCDGTAAPAVTSACAVTTMAATIKGTGLVDIRVVDAGQEFASK